MSDVSGESKLYTAQRIRLTLWATNTYFVLLKHCHQRAL